MTLPVHIDDSPRPRLRAAVIAFALVIAVIGALVTIDTFRAGRSEHRLAEALMASPRVDFEPEVTLGGFPYWSHARRGEFPGLTITARGVAAAGPAELAGVPQTCASTPCRAELGVRADEVKGMDTGRWSATRPIMLTAVTASAKLDSVNLGRMLDITDLAVNTPAPANRAGGGGPGDGLLERTTGVLLTGTVSLPPSRPSPRTQVRYPPSSQRFTGQRVRVSVLVDLAVDGNDLVITATDFYGGPEEHADGRVPAQFRAAVLARFSGRVPYPRLPWGVSPTKANSAGSDILISGTAPYLTVAPDRF
ncbi:DUF2993 domain-containing protein [Gordonia sp. X0973]|uniref:LmeA family phospholipid-binding protein n=1 Tax=Gordonia sp. X0973 TaxID=2742602 RepID=UPI000F544A96|nr:DUF2993 domain-containing protein [Gordonia sp. X0973]QKT06330.1 DUF2993 domain-containing protein [Gordonia sp. X0973]